MRCYAPEGPGGRGSAGGCGAEGSQASEPATVRSLAGRMADLASMTDWLEKPACYRFLSLMSAWGWQFFEEHDTIREVVI